MFESLFDISSTSIAFGSALYMLLFALISGLIISFTYMKTYPGGNHNQNFALTMVLLPLVISLIIMLIGSDIARAFSLAGAFSIIRFRSAPGEPKDIGFVLFSLSAGLAAGVGAQGYTVAFSVALCLVMYILSKFNFAQQKNTKQLLKIVIPEEFDYQEEFDALFELYNVHSKLVKVKSTSLGSLFQLYYELEVPKDIKLPDFMNDIRSRNSNLNISINMLENTDYKDWINMKKMILVTLFICTLLLSSCKSDSSELLELEEYLNINDTNELFTEEEINELLDVTYGSFTGSDEVNLDQEYENIIDFIIVENSDSIVITEKGDYLLEGTYTSTIVIDVDDEDVTLYLNNATITSTSGPAILVLSADDVTLSAVEDTVNYVSDSANHPLSEDGSDYNAAIYSYSDLVLNGLGTLEITGNFNNAINTKDDIRILEVTLLITSVDDGIIGNDSIQIKDATITVVSEGDALVASNDESEQKGFILIKSGTLDLTTNTDAIQAVNDILIYGGTITIDALDSGIQSDASITIGGGIFNIDSSSDAVNASLNLYIYDGTFTINAGDDAIHADYTLEINGGDITIENSYEGIEALDIIINGGLINIFATDDGLNATTGGGQIHGPTYTSLGGAITINGGIIQVNSLSDGVDANGSIVMTGGYLIVSGSSEDNQSSIDYDESFTISGGTLVALGSTGMIQTVSNTSTQASITYADSTSYKAGTTITLYDNNEEALFSITAVKAFTGITMSTEDMFIGETYTLELDDDTFDFTQDSLITVLGDGGSTQTMPGLPPRR